jgi:hypothetical protein
MESKKLFTSLQTENVTLGQRPAVTLHASCFGHILISTTQIWGWGLLDDLQTITGKPPFFSPLLFLFSFHNKSIFLRVFGQFACASMHSDFCAV